MSGYQVVRIPDGLSITRPIRVHSCPHHWRPARAQAAPPANRRPEPCWVAVAAPPHALPKATGMGADFLTAPLLGHGTTLIGTDSRPIPLCPSSDWGFEPQSARTRPSESPWLPGPTRMRSRGTGRPRPGPASPLLQSTQASLAFLIMMLA
jgi:hypothetical protein